MLPRRRSPFQKAKFDEANKLFDQTLKIDPKYMQAYRFKAKCFNSQGKFDEIVKISKKAIKIDPNFVFMYNAMGMAYKCMKRYKEALEVFDKAISIDPTFLFPYNNRGNVLREMGRYEEAIEAYRKAIELNPEGIHAYNGQGQALTKLGKDEEALKLYDVAVSKFPQYTLALCNKAKLLNKLGRHKEAREALRKVEEIFQSGFVDPNLTPGNRNFIKETLEMITDLDKIEAQTQEMIRQQQIQQNPQVQKFIEKIQILQQKKEDVTSKLIEGLDENESSQSSGDLRQEVAKLKAEFEKLKQEMANTKKEIEQIKSQLQNIKEELNNKMDNFRKKLDGDLAKTEFSPEDKTKLKDYFNAFFETFSSTHVTSQVIDSGQVQLDSDSSKAILLSVVASFAPFIGSALSKGVSSLANFLASKEMKTNARKMKGLASDATDLSQVIGGAAYKIVLDEQKQQQILNITNEDLKKISGKLFDKIFKFCQNLGEEIDGYLYTKMYKTPSARLGHNDANKLIELWLFGKIDPYAVQDDMIKHALSLKGEENESEPPSEQPSEPENTGRSSCCNMF